MEFGISETVIPVSNEFLQTVLTGGRERADSEESVFTRVPDLDEFYEYDHENDMSQSFKSDKNQHCCCYCCSNLKKLWCFVLLILLIGIAIGGSALYIASMFKALRDDK